MVASDGGKGQCCKECGHCKRDETPTNKGKKWKKGNNGNSGGEPKWCSYHHTKTHSDTECHKQREINAIANATAKANLAVSKRPNQADFPNVGSAHLTQPAQPEPTTFGFSFSAMGASLAEAAASPNTDTSTSKETTNKASSPETQNYRLPEGVFGAF